VGGDERRTGGRDEASRGTGTEEDGSRWAGGVVTVRKTRRGGEQLMDRIILNPRQKNISSCTAQLIPFHSKRQLALMTVTDHSLYL
jgi:hypothetical protein